MGFSETAMSLHFLVRSSSFAVNFSSSVLRGCNRISRLLLLVNSLFFVGTFDAPLPFAKTF